MHLQVPFSYALLCIIVIIAILKCSPFALRRAEKAYTYRMHQKLKIITANDDSILARCPSHHRQYCCCNIRSRVLANKVIRHDFV